MPARSSKESARGEDVPFRYPCKVVLGIPSSAENSIKFNPLLSISLFNVAEIFSFISKIATSLNKRVKRTAAAVNANISTNRPPFRQRRKGNKPCPKREPACFLPDSRIKLCFAISGNWPGRLLEQFLPPNDYPRSPLPVLGPAPAPTPDNRKGPVRSPSPSQ